jgi:ADP-dependent NAD(P)H-hydrate dehydratase / NAD(P)H-hydrate epimerase
MREWEAASWKAGRTEADVIRHVGKALAEHALRLTKTGDLILVLSGRGNNGADARATLEHFDERRLDTLDVKHPAIDLEELQTLLAIRPALIVDGLFGIGVNRPLDTDWQKFIGAVNAAKLPVLSVDVPSGLNADTGEPQGAAIEATVTLTVGTPKIGLLKPAAWPFVGRLEIARDVGLLPRPLFTSELSVTLPEDFAGFPLPRPVASHKGSFGHAGIFSGSQGYHGAAVLAARGAERAQPGLITLVTQESVYLPIAAQLQGSMVKAWPNGQSQSDKFSAVLIGPGLAAPEVPDEMKQFARELWKNSPRPLIVDASALDWLPRNFATRQNSIRVVTPHPGEAARLLNRTAADIQAARPEALRELSRTFGNCIVVLKGHQTLIGRGDGEIFVNSSGNPYLAQGGAGDVLAGFLGGLLAQPLLQADPLKTVRYGVWRHGAAADSLQTTGSSWVVKDLAEALGHAQTVW